MNDFAVEAEATRHKKTIRAIYYPHTEQKRVEIELQVPGKWLPLGVGSWRDNKIQDIVAVLPEGLLDALSSELLKKLG